MDFYLPKSMENSLPLTRVKHRNFYVFPADNL